MSGLPARWGAKRPSTWRGRCNPEARSEQRKHHPTRRSGRRGRVVRLRSGDFRLWKGGVSPRVSLSSEPRPLRPSRKSTASFSGAGVEPHGLRSRLLSSCPVDILRQQLSLLRLIFKMQLTNERPHTLVTSQGGQDERADCTRNSLRSYGTPPLEEGK